MKGFLMMILMLVAFSVFGAEAAEPAAKLGATEWIAIICGCLFAISEVLAAIPALKSNSIFQIIQSILKAIVGKK